MESDSMEMVERNAQFGAFSNDPVLSIGDVCDQHMLQA